MLKYTTVMKPGINHQTFPEWMRYTWWKMTAKPSKEASEFLQNPIRWTGTKMG